MTLPPLSEKDFYRQVVELATIRHWLYLHLRPAMTRDSWRTPISGPLGKGWPDLILLRKGRRLAWELKTDKGLPSNEQLLVLQALEDAGFEVGVYRPSDWALIEAGLK